MTNKPQADRGGERCAYCGEPRQEHSYNGGCYGKCGKYVPTTASPGGEELEQRKRLIADMNDMAVPRIITQRVIQHICSLADDKAELERRCFDDDRSHQALLCKVASLRTRIAELESGHGNWVSITEALRARIAALEEALRHLLLQAEKSGFCDYWIGPARRALHPEPPAGYRYVNNGDANVEGTIAAPSGPDIEKIPSEEKREMPPEIEILRQRIAVLEKALETIANGSLGSQEREISRAALCPDTEGDGK